MTKTINFSTQSVEFKFMTNNRDVVANSNLRQDIERYGIAQELIVLPIEEYDGKLNENVSLKFGNGNDPQTFVVLDGQHRLTCLNEICNKIRKVEMENAKIEEDSKQKRKPVPTLASSEIPLKIVDKKFLDRFGGLDNYVIMLNNTGKKWNNKDFIINAYQRNEESFDLRVINKLQNDGMSISTISRWLSGNTKVVNSKSIQRLAQGDEIDHVNSKWAIKLYLSLVTLGFSKTFLRKRYMIDAINKLLGAQAEKKVLFKISKVTSIKAIENANYADGDVVKQIIDIINADYDSWRKADDVKIEDEENAIKACNLLDALSDYDIEDYLTSKSLIDTDIPNTSNAA